MLALHFVFAAIWLVVRGRLQRGEAMYKSTFRSWLQRDLQISARYEREHALTADGLLVS